MDYKAMAKSILENIGGSENVANMTHCATRLRLTLKDTSKADDRSRREYRRCDQCHQ